jgi:hypothetical protein
VCIAEEIRVSVAIAIEIGFHYIGNREWPQHHCSVPKPFSSGDAADVMTEGSLNQIAPFKGNTQMNQTSQQWAV